jgi:hypothetical protein
MQCAIMHKRPTYLVTLFATAASLTLSGCLESSASTTPLPPLLQKATAGSGWSSACPSRNEKEQKMIETTGQFAVSPEVEQRLRDQFPPGSNESRLIAALTTQGFKQEAPCETDQTIQRASFFRKGTGILPYDIGATVYWKIDEQGRIVWTKGFVAYGGL